ncbi:cutinase-like protein [Paramyrothecium foliicola]|nr:cutinase-like protein [Paramyrothecium foliicola]
MRYTAALGPLCLFIAAVRAQECPETPDVDIGNGVPPRPEDIPAGCSDFEILVARGTGEPNYEPDGKFGVVVGDPVVSNTTKILPGARGYPVQYPASSAIVTGTIQGARDVVQRVVSQSIKCPRQTFALVGYSQGAGVMHRAAGDIPRSLYPKIKALVMFGDPSVKTGTSFPSELQPKVLQNCATGDPVCDSGRCFFYHLVYIRPEWIDPTVGFIVKGFRGA